MKPKLKEKEKAALEEFTTQVREIAGKNLVRILLYGSKARGDSHKDSDIDVAIIVRRLSSEIKDLVIRTSCEVNARYDYEVFIMPHLLPIEAFSSGKWLILPLIKNIKREGTLL